MTLNANQFASVWEGKGVDPVSRWDERMEGHLPETHHTRQTQGEMPIEEARKYVDPVFHPWEKFHQQEGAYLYGLARHISQRGVVAPIQIDADKKTIFDGHHRLAAAELAGLKTIPYRFQDHRGDNTEPVPPR